MSNYTKQINWAGKDALADSDPNKVISGDDFDTEFTAAQTAINSKADLNGSATESFSATTANAGTNTTQVATTEFVTSAIAAEPDAGFNDVIVDGTTYIGKTIYVNDGAATGGEDGDIWFEY